MSFVFYDTETTGISTDFDQILQFAAIRTDGDLNVLDEIEIRGRLLPHVIPHPGALRVTGMTIDRVTDPNSPSHYEMIRQVRSKLLEWSPAIFVGYNSMSFDEHLLRQALFQTLHPPYLTNTNQNCRADALALVQAASVFVPDCLSVPKNQKGASVFKLDQLAPSNGFEHGNAHDALADVHATIHLARCVKDKAPEVWNRFVRFAQKAAVADFVQEEDGFLLTEFYFNKPYHFPVGFIGARPGQGNISLCLDLSVDQAELASLGHDELIAVIKKSPKPVRQVRTNAAPSLMPLYEASEELLGDWTVDELAERAVQLRENRELRSRLLSAFADAQEEKEPSPHFEQQIYDGFVTPSDEKLMEEFHDTDWSERGAIVERFADRRLRHFGRRLLHNERPDLLHPDHHAEISLMVRERIMSEAPAGWTTLAVAISETDKLLASATPSDTAILLGYREYLSTISGQLATT